MTDEIKIWAMDGSSDDAELVSPTDRVEREEYLERVLAKNPDMLMPGLTLVGRQTPTENGSLDLLGVDEDGRLVVFELKRKNSTRDAVAQVIDYCSYLESLSEEELAESIAKHSGKNGIGKIKDFEEWYGEQHEGKELTQMKPVRMALVGLGADAAAQRMVEFLTENGVDISLFTFRGYNYGNRTLLAGQMEGQDARDVGSSPRQQNRARRRRNHMELAERLGIMDLCADAVKELSVANTERVRKLGISFHMPGISFDNSNATGSHSVVIDESTRMIRITFYPASIHLCWDRFQELGEKIQFHLETPPNAPTTSKVLEQWYCLLDAAKWETHKEELIALANDVIVAWRKKRDQTREKRREATAQRAV